MVSSDFVIGVDLGGTKIYTALANKEGEILAEVKIPTEANDGPEHVITRIVATVNEVLKLSGFSGKPGCLAIGAPGPLDPRRGFVYQAPNLGWRDVPLKPLLEEALHIPVVVGNDANLAALGEHVFGAVRGVDDMIYVTVSTGIGGGLILGGKLYHGASSGAGEIGHMTVEPDGPVCSCGNRGCLEALASGTAMAKRARQLVEAGSGRGIFMLAGGAMENITARVVSRAAAGGDEEALGILAGAGRALGIGLACVINLLNPSLVLLGGGATQAGRPLWQAMFEELNKRAIRSTLQQVRVMPATLGPRSGLLGAVALAIGKG